MKTKITIHSFMKQLLFIGIVCMSMICSEKGHSQILTIGEETTTSFDFPIATCMGYNYTQQIYTAAEITGAGATGPVLITKIAFKASMWSSSPTDNYKDWTIFMGNTDVGAFVSSTSWIPTSAMSTVFDGVIPTFVTADEWMEITLSSPFLWDGTSNVVVAVHEKTPSWFCSQDWVAYFSDVNRSMAYSNDGSNPDPNSPPSSTSGPSSMMPYVQFSYVDAENCEDLEFAVGEIEGTNVCPDVAFTVANTGSILGIGVERVWQVRAPSGTGAWTTISGAEGLNYTNSAGLSEAADYRCIVSCPASGESDTTNEVTVNINSFFDCYCEPTMLGCDWDAVINDVSTDFATTNISNMGTGCGGGYTSYVTEHEASAVQFMEVTVNVGIVNSNAGVKIWIDWNQNGLFESDELVGAPEELIEAGSTYSTSFEVPGDAIPGTTRMRVIAGSWTTGFESCPSLWGEAEDYAFTVIEALPCDELDLVAGTLAPFEICSSTPFTVVNAGTTLGAGMNREWQQRIPSGTGTWTTIVGATGTNYTSTAGITEDVDYRCIVSCPASGESETTNEVTISISPFADCYCIPEYISGCMWGATINDFSTSDAITDISNLGTGCPDSDLPGYTDYSADHVATVMQLQTISATVGISNNSGGVKIWIDYNHNGIFEASEIVGETMELITDGSDYTASFTIPLTAMTGWTKMRVRTVSWNTAFGPCDEFWDGEAEDYAIQIEPAPVCSDPAVIWPTEIPTVASPGAVCGNGPVYLSIESALVPLASGITYEWEMSATGTGSWVSITGDLSSPGYTVSDVSSTTYFRCNIKCEGANIVYSQTIMVASVTPDIPVLTSGQHCGPGEVELSGTIGEGSIYWYTSPDGGTPFAEGTSIMTPSISTTTTYYAGGGAFAASQMQIGESMSSSSPWSPGPFNINNRRSTMQMLYSAEQIAAIGGTAGIIEDVRFNLVGLPSEGIPDYTISIKMVPSSMHYLTSWQTTGFTEVYSNTLFEPSETGWQVFPFSTPLFYDGVSGIIVQICWSNVEAFWSGTGTHQYTLTPGHMLYMTNSDEGNSCGDIGEWTNDELPNVIFNFQGCVSELVPVVAFIRDTPTIQIDLEDGEYCLFNNEITITSSPEQPLGTTYTWNTGANSPSIISAGSGEETKFWITVTNEWGCISSDTANLTLKPSPTVDLGSDIAVCEGSDVVLDAGTAAAEYYWSTGESTKTITINDGGVYTVLIANEFGCLASDTINVVLEGIAPSIDGIVVNNLSAHSFQFTPLNPQNIVSYKWDFGDESPVSFSDNPMHEYPGSGSYTVTLEVTSECGSVEYFTYVTIVLGVSEVELSQSLTVFPNPTLQILNIETNDGIKMDRLVVINSLGQIVLEKELFNTTQSQINVEGLANGNYYLKVYGDKGEMVKRFQVLK